MQSISTLLSQLSSSTSSNSHPSSSASTSTSENANLAHVVSTIAASFTNQSSVGGAPSFTLNPLPNLLGGNLDSLLSVTTNKNGCPTSQNAFAEDNTFQQDNTSYQEDPSTLYATTSDPPRLSPTDLLQPPPSSSLHSFLPVMEGQDAPLQRRPSIASINPYDAKPLASSTSFAEEQHATFAVVANAPTRSRPTLDTHNFALPEVMVSATNKPESLLGRRASEPAKPHPLSLRGPSPLDFENMTSSAMNSIADPFSYHENDMHSGGAYGSASHSKMFEYSSPNLPNTQTFGTDPHRMTMDPQHLPATAAMLSDFQHSLSSQLPEFHGSLAMYERRAHKLAGGLIKPKAKKMTRRANAPRKPLSAYLLFCEETRPRIKELRPDIHPWEMSSQLGQLWKKLDKQEKLVGRQ